MVKQERGGEGRGGGLCEKGKEIWGGGEDQLRGTMGGGKEDYGGGDNEGLGNRLKFHTILFPLYPIYTLTPTSQCIYVYYHKSLISF